MARRLNQSDPTANRAVANVDREAKAAPKRKLLHEFPEVFDDLSDYGCRFVAFRALGLAGDNVWAIRLEHLEKARAEYGAQA
ncbi:hypothetical protein ENKNEFLB_02819 [Nocardioides aquaticus]|uniref:Uncharacterized protein n=1 Tax=Nocardioides aquaticus TaxID=160826 RepID=A0ABX8EIT4_9ACTN|nr:hypothetical protein [Nocardioides aquaticus]QVT80424.1 hypothetical protein ENKNEFLB_02819 [Nocardioides aquaticus]